MASVSVIVHVCNLEMFLNSLKLSLMVIVYLVDITKYYDAFEEKLTALKMFATRTLLAQCQKC